MTKVVIVEDSQHCLDKLILHLEDTEAEVKGVLVVTQSLDELCLTILELGPDIILLDSRFRTHNVGYGGKEVAQKLRFPPSRLIGISSLGVVEQPYCGAHFEKKLALPRTKEVARDDRFRDEYMQAIEELHAIIKRFIAW